MHLNLTPFLLDFLSQQGYRYFLSKTIVSYSNKRSTVQLILKPVMSRPHLPSLPEGFDTYFQINKEPRQMAQGVDDTQIVVQLSDSERKLFETLV